jgi:hypothetical protein
MKAYILILKYHGAGFYSILNKLMNYFQNYTPIYKVIWDVHCQSNHYGDGEVMGKVFQHYENSEYKDYEIESIDCDMYIDYNLTGERAMWLYSEEGCKTKGVSLEWREELNGFFRNYIHLQPEIQGRFDRIKQEIKAFGKKQIITMLIRHPALKSEQPNGKMPEFYQYEEEIKKISPNLEETLIICSTDHNDAYEYFNSRYSNIIFPSIERAGTGEPELFSSRGRSDTAVIEALFSVLYLTLGDHFIHHTSNMATATLYMNPRIQNHFIIG